MSTSTRRAPLFVYPPLPKYEIRLYCAITACAVVYAWWCVYKASTRWTFRIGHVASVTDLPIFGRRFKDEIDWEWSRWSPIALTYLPHLLFNSAVFNFAPRFVSEKVWIPIYIATSMCSTAIVYTPRLVAYSLAQGVFVFCCTHLCRSTWVVWLSSLPILYVVMNHTTVLSDDPFLVLLFVSYTLLSYISFNLELVRGNIRPEDRTVGARLLRMLFYAFYQPYLISLIVLYPDFERQFRERRTRQRNWKRTFLLALRIGFWWALLQLALHFLYFNSILHDVDFSARLPKNEFVTLGMAMCNFFHLKYVIIFGVPTVFALLDNMQPKDGPICIARVALISKIWRGFDRGLYDFFKEYLHLPICQPTFSFPRKILGILISYGFVLMWHGFLHHNVIWVLLNIIELIIEFGSKGIYSIESVKKWREDHLSDTNFRRLLAWLQIVPFAFGLYSNFYFLGGSKIGYLFVDRIFWQETVPVRWPFLLLISIGYNYMHVTMEAERWLSTRDKLKTV
ncbi:Protein-cysteine N-palmitoyltransferase Rasp [Aphelenchoides besseyi]|nr:Protein-cysteine N-palmitoyltransferase Rasp [Aphelenchoides besseyi]